MVDELGLISKRDFFNKNNKNNGLRKFCKPLNITCECYNYKAKRFVPQFQEISKDFKFMLNFIVFFDIAVTYCSHHLCLGSKIKCKFPNKISCFYVVLFTLR